MWNRPTRLETDVQGCRVAGLPGPRPGGAQAKLRTVLRAALRTVREVAGAPDYERYLEHHAVSHPGQVPLSAREYYADFVSRRFGSGPSRCC